MQEWKNYLADQNTRTQQGNQKYFQEMEKDLKDYLKLVNEWKRSNTAVNENAMLEQQKKLKDVYGVEANSSNAEEVVGKQLDYAQNRQESAIKEMIEALKQKNEELDKEAKRLSGVGGWGRGVAGNLGIGGQLSRGEAQKRRVEIPKEQGENKAKIAELQEELRRLQKRDISKETLNAESAKNKDFSMAEGEKEAKATRERDEALQQWKNSIADTPYQAELRQVMEKYLVMVDRGVDIQEAKNIAEEEIAQITEKHQKKYAEEVQKSIDGYKSAFKQYLDAQKKLSEAEKNRATIAEDIRKQEQQLLNEKKQEQLDEKRQNIANRKRDFGFSLEDGENPLKKKSAKERRNERLDARIEEKLQRRRNGERVHFSNREKRRLKQYRDLEKKDKALEATQKQMQAADRQKEAAERQQEAAEKLKEASLTLKSAITGKDETEGNLKKAKNDLKKKKGSKLDARKEASKVFGDYKGKGLIAPGIGKATASRSFDYTGQFQTLHNDLVDLKKKAYFVK